ncbi:response regulator transcription factor [Bacillus sp. ISL-18]|uniref:response regulator n=1 Tax=Bacillus sp. ISL-18 TaxID=2819118 RepID=UPI002035CD67|nr:response regulator transcription factor [Bacillus sp. ISL-18]
MLIVDDHLLVGEATKLVIQKEMNIEVRVETSCLKALELVRIQSFDLILVDLQMPEMDGFEWTKKVLAIDPSAIILIYSDFKMKPYLNTFMESGAAGFVLKNDSKEQLIMAIQCALAGNIVIPVSFLKAIYRNNQEKHLENTSLNENDTEILKELIKGKKNKDIAQALYIGQRTLEYRLTNLFQKLGVHSRIEAVLKAKEIGF